VTASAGTDRDDEKSDDASFSFSFSFVNAIDRRCMYVCITFALLMRYSHTISRVRARQRERVSTYYAKKNVFLSEETSWLFLPAFSKATTASDAVAQRRARVFPVVSRVVPAPA